jgi:predicted lipid-binding transport protein (Tim44 family)
MRKQTERTIALTDITINAIEGGFAGALLGALISVLLAGLIWCVQVGLLGGLPVIQDVVYSLTTGAVYGAFVGAAWALADYWTHRLPPQWSAD